MPITLQELDKMSGEEYGLKLKTDPNFKAEVEALLNVPPVTVPAPVPPAGEADPSMPAAAPRPVPTRVGDAAPVAAPAPAVPPVAVPAELPELRYEWQPKDENGKPMGGVQVVKYRTETEKFEKMQECTNLLIRQLRKERRERALGTTEETPDDAEKFQNITEFKPRDLSSEERFKLSQDIANPETFADARDRLIESAFGAKPSVLASTLNDTQRFIIQQRAVENYIEFVNATGFYDTVNNRQVLTGWVGKRNLAPTVANFTIALNTLRQSGLIDEAPAVQQVTPPTPAPTPVVEPVVPVVTVPNPQAPVVTPPVLGTEQPQAKRHSHVPSGLNASVASAAGTPVPAVGSSVTLEAIDKMPADVFKVWIKNPENRKLHDQLENEAAQRRRARQ